ncbi:alpha/beta hydrolase family protein [Pseudohongiella sp. O18]|uniref:alpha/beta hydrolase family protein n=1 Tax=Pseudohongiella sp. O18 TaxID=2904248 RepID=UPI001F1CF7F2|nr:alpha/beta fold hydrolase [Pseudohongiella sp. O18]
MKRLLILVMTLSFSSAHAQDRDPINRIDLTRPDAPALAVFGDHPIGVRTIRLVDTDRPDVLNASDGAEISYYDRELTVEVWYPATADQSTQTGTEYTTTTRNPAIIATLHGRAVRDAEPETAERFPLVIMSHGYPGNRYLLSHLGENLASKGYVVASIDHRDSTYEDQQNFSSTLYNRAPDQRFVLDAIASGQSEAAFISASTDADNTALIGYSMGGYGVLNNLGAGYSDAGVGFIGAPPNRLLHELAASNAEFASLRDPRIKAGIPIAPWGMNMGFWEAQGLAGLTGPVLFVAGDADQTSGYDNGVKAAYNGAVNADPRYMLVFKNAGHSVAAPIPLPAEFLGREDTAGAGHYTDPAWDTLRMNNILQHFATAFLNLYLKGDENQRRYLELPTDGAGDNPWEGFDDGDAVGLRFYHNEPAD